MELRQRLTSLEVSGSVKSFITLMDSLMGIIVKRDTTSTLKNISFSSICLCFIFSINYDESFINELVFPTNSFNLFARNFASL